MNDVMPDGMFVMPDWVRQEVPTLITDGDDVREAGVLPRAWLRSDGRDGYPIWRPDHVSGFEPGTKLAFIFAPTRAYLIVHAATEPTRREIWWRGDA